MSRDPHWPTAARWLAHPPQPDGGHHYPDFAVIGIPSSRRSISPSNADTTPQAVRNTLQRFSTWSIDRNLSLDDVRPIDMGNISNPDGPDGWDRTIAIMKSLGTHDMFVAVLGGDNSVTLPSMLGIYSNTLESSALITFDAHHDLRDGWSNGSPVRQLVEAGLPGRNIVQIGIAGFANSRAYTERAKSLGIHIITREQCHRRTAEDVMAEAFAVIGDKPTHIDVDIDVCDRAVVPGCPASSPGGISAQYLRDLVYLGAAQPQTRSMDFVEVDAHADAPDGRTVRLAALCLLEGAAGLASRKQQGRRTT